MTSKLRIEILQAAPGPGVIHSLLASQTLTVTGYAAVESAPTPQPATTIYGQVARLTAPVGAVLVTWDGSEPSEVNGLLVMSGDDVRIAVGADVVFTIVESPDVAGGGAAAPPGTLDFSQSTNSDLLQDG